MDDFDLLSDKKAKRKKNRPCVPCRVAKRKCEGGFPCHRCLDREESGKCVPVVQKKPGRKRKNDDSTESAPLSEEYEPVLKQHAVLKLKGSVESMEEVMNELTLIKPHFYCGKPLSSGEVKIEGVAQSLLSVLLSNAENVLKDRPRDILASFGLNYETFVAIEVPSTPVFPSKMDAFQEGTIESGHTSEEHKDICPGVELLIGRRVKDISQHDPVLELGMSEYLRSKVPIGRTSMHKVVFLKRVLGRNGMMYQVVMEGNYFFDERGWPRWGIITILQNLGVLGYADEKTLNINRFRLESLAASSSASTSFSSFSSASTSTSFSSSSSSFAATATTSSSSSMEEEEPEVDVFEDVEEFAKRSMLQSSFDMSVFDF